jgi:hypothetical protein
MKSLVEAIAERVIASAERRLPDRDQLKDLQRQLRGLARRIESTSRRRGRVGRPPSHRKCQVPGCGLPHVAQGYCSRHYQAWRRKRLQGDRRMAARRGRRPRAS